MKEDLFEDIVTRFLEGNATAHEKAMLLNWVKQDPAREEMLYFQISKRESECPQYLPDVDSKSKDYEEFLKHGKRLSMGQSHDFEPVHSPSRNYWWMVAASVVLLLSVSLYFSDTSLFYKTYIAEQGRIRTVTLADSSVVTLNANSSIKVRLTLMGAETREVWVDGEAFFDIARRKDLSKFIVHTGNVDVEVLGTKFNVNNRRGTTEVMLVEGKVKLVKKDQAPLIMKPGEQVSVSDVQDHFEATVAEPEKYEAWRNNMLVFENTPLSEVGQIIVDYYGVNVVVSDSLLATRQFTGTLPNNDLDVILLSLRTAYKIGVERTGNQIILKHNKSK